MTAKECPTLPAAHRIHTCPMLDDAGLYLELIFVNESSVRWSLCHASHGRPADSDLVYMRAVAFCPGCGLDVRADLSYRSPGRPRMNALYAKVQRAGKRAALAATNEGPSQYWSTDALRRLTRGKY